MDREQVEKWIETTEGAAWLNEHKRGLIEKRDELLQKVKDLNEEHRKATQQVNDLQSTLAQERDAVRATLVDREVSSFVDRHVVPGLREGAKALFTGLDVTVAADGKLRTPVVSKDNLAGLLQAGEEAPDGLPLGEYLDRWSKTDEAKAYLSAPQNSGGGAKGGVPTSPNSSGSTAFEKAVLERMKV